MNKKIKLVLSGSGTLYPVHVGGILRLAEAGFEITEVCGTSGGAIVAAALASGYKPNQELVKMVKATLPGKNDLIDYSLWSLVTQWGLIKGEKIEQVFGKYMPKTMGESKIPLHIVTVNLDRRMHKIFSSAQHPKMNMARAVRASMSIPGVFVPVKIDNETYVDGGIAANYFLDIFGTGKDVIGLRFHSASTKPKPITGIKEYIEANINTTMEANMREHIEDAVYARTIMLNSKHSGLNFYMTDADVDSMIEEGYEAADRWLKATELQAK